MTNAERERVTVSTAIDAAIQALPDNMVARQINGRYRVPLALLNLIAGANPQAFVRGTLAFLAQLAEENDIPSGDFMQGVVDAVSSERELATKAHELFLADNPDAEHDHVDYDPDAEKGPNLENSDDLFSFLRRVLA